MTFSSLYDVSHWLIGLMVFILMILAHMAGVRLGRRHRQDDAALTQAATVQTSTLALLGLLLGFTLAMAVSRFELRKQLLVNEANAIGTAWLRSRIWPDVARETHPLLLRYVRIRLDLRAHGYDPDRVQHAIHEANDIQEKLWKRATALAAAEPNSTAMMLYLQALNEMIDLQTKRVAARANNVPELVLILLDVLAITSIAMLGYSAGLANLRHGGESWILAALMVLVMLIIMDLDRPDRGFIHTNPIALVELEQQLVAHSFAK